MGREGARGETVTWRLALRMAHTHQASFDPFPNSLKVVNWHRQSGNDRPAVQSGPQLHRDTDLPGTLCVPEKATVPHVWSNGCEEAGCSSPVDMQVERYED